MNSLSIYIGLFLILMIGSIESWSQSLQPDDFVEASDSLSMIVLSIDVEQSFVEWRGTEMWGRSSHEGILTLSKGYLEIKNDQLIGGYFIADMNSISVTDIPKSDPIPRRNLTEHLKSEDFFYVEEYPVAKFEITNTEQMKGDSLLITGNLSIRDVTQSISITGTKIEDENAIISYEALFEINRFDWNISYQGSYWERISSIIDNNLVDAEMSIKVQLVASEK